MWEVDEINEMHKSLEKTANDVVFSVEEEHNERVREEQEVIETLSEAVKRIEEANLWKTLLNLDVFEAGSARPEIIESANKKIRAFARENLEKCVGINQSMAPKKSQNNIEVKLPFDTEEMQALKILAAKVLKRDITKAVLSDYKPKIKQVGDLESTKAADETTKKTTKSLQNIKTKLLAEQQTPKQNAQTKKNKQKVHPPGYISPTTNYTPQVQQPIVSGDSNSVNMNSLVSSLIQQASGGNIVSQDTDANSTIDDVNERF